MNYTCRIELLGGLCLEQGGQTITRFRTHKTAELLAYLAYFRERAHPREVLIDLFWPENDVDAGRHSLSMALSALRPQLEPPGTAADGSVLVADRHSVGLNPAIVVTDVMEFESALDSSKCAAGVGQIAFLASAVDLYRGELLSGYYGDWIFPEQQRLEELCSQALRQLVSGLEQAGESDRALQYALRSVSVNRLREEAHQEVIRLYNSVGRPTAALRQYRELERILQQELECAPSENTLALLPAIGPNSQEPERSNQTVQSTEMASGMPPPPNLPPIRSVQLEPVGGAIALTSRFYVTRCTDEEFHSALARRDSIVLVKGARQVGKTSLLARGLQRAREAGAQVVLTHFQVFNAAHLKSAETLLMAIAESIADQLDLDIAPADFWDERRGPNPNFRRFMRREVLGKVSVPLVWGLDEVDRLFLCPFATELFGLFRSWHDERALDPSGPWAGLTLAMAYSTEAHLFITDINQSPFNVGTRLALEDFDLSNVADLNARYGSPLKNQGEITRFSAVVGGHPYLVSAGLHELAAHGAGISEFEARSSSDDWIFGEHLRRIVALLAKDGDLAAVAQGALEGRPCPTWESFLRLRNAGLMSGRTEAEARFRCPVYAAYLAKHLR